MEREKRLLNQDWKFHYGDIVSIRNRWAWGKSGSWNQGPESGSFDDSQWRRVNIPHDFVIETRPCGYMEKEFSEDNAIPAMEDVNNIHTTAGSFQKNVGWYRKHFFIPGEDEGKKIFLVFEGVYRDSTAYLNEFFIGGERSGYSRISYDITDFVNYGGDNILSVRCDARAAEGWFYEGGGIYRDVYLLVTAPVYIDSVFVHTEVEVPERTADIVVETELSGLQEAEREGGFGSGAVLEIGLYDKCDNCVAGIRKPVEKQKEIAVLRLEEVRLWDTEDPYLYQAKVRLLIGEEQADRYETSFGIRKIQFDAQRGFLLNGRPVKIKGVCCHQNHGGLGIALTREMYLFRIRKLKEMGANAYRTSHYPPSPELLDICDREGVLVMDETRLLSSERGDLSQLATMVKRDRNHPSVILYSIGNEEAQSQATPQGARIAGTMIKEIKKLDPFTPVTMALLMWDLKNRRPLPDHGLLAGIIQKLDVAGFNYHEDRWEEFHREYPDKPMICTEQGTFRSTRSCAVTEAEKCHLAITDKNQSSYMMGASQWHSCRPDWVSGLFLWTGFDYYGEPTPYAWPAVSSQFGCMDICGYPKDFYYYYKAWWSGGPVCHLFPHWNLERGQSVDVHVFSNAEEVELFVNGRSRGRKTMERDGYLVWDGILFEPGEVRAVGYKAGEVWAEELVQTAGPAVRLRMTEEFRERDIRIVRVEALDREGRLVPDAEGEVSFKLTGGRLLGASNGDPSDHMLPTGPERRIFNGLAQVIVSCGGEAVLEAESESFEGASLIL